MFYSNNNNYMQDLYAYNQVPDNNTYNTFGMNLRTPGPMGNNITYSNFNGIYSNNQNQQNPNNLYPNIYRIINPVVSRVVSGSNLSYITEDNLNNMVDTVYNIVEGEVSLEDKIDTASQTTSSSNTSNISNSNTKTTTTLMQDTRNNLNITNSNFQNNSSNRRNNRDSLLRDLIKILILKQLLSKNNTYPMPFNYQYPYYSNFMLY